MVFFAIASCNKPDTYSGQLKKELKKGVRNDSIFFDIHFGDTQKEFFNTCWEYNKKGVLFHGPKNMNVQYTIKAPNDSVSKIKMLFYPDFKLSSEIRRLNVEFEFSGWAPWNNHLFGSKLVPHVKSKIMEWYSGNEFWELNDKEGNRSWAKIDGNREINMWVVKDKYVSMTITDKSYVNE